MTSKTLVIVGSARKESDTRKFVDGIFNDVNHKMIDLLDLKIYGYEYSHHYPADDEYEKVVEEFLAHQQIIFATPVYWYAMSAGMKTLFDRFSDLMTYKKTTGRKLKGKSTALVTVGAEKELPQGFEIPFSCTSTYFDMEYLGSVYHRTKDEPNKHSIENFRNLLGL